MTGASDRAISIEYTALLISVLTHEYFHAYQHQLITSIEDKTPLNTQKRACINAYESSFKDLLCIENSLILFGSDVNYSETPVEASAYQIQSGMYYHVLKSLQPKSPEQKSKP